MSTKTETFASLIKRFEYHYDLRSTFDDFLTMTICAFSQNLQTRKSHDEELYLETVAKYKDDELRFLFPEMLGCLVNEMTERIESDLCHDVLGEFYEQNLYRRGASQYFTPWPICKFMTKSVIGALEGNDLLKPLRILDPSCGSGRMLLASAKEYGPQHQYFGIDIDQTCVKMAAINLFLSGAFNSEVMCSNALVPDDFRCSYKISFVPFGIFKIMEMEKSFLWNLNQQSFGKPKTHPDKWAPAESANQNSDPGLQLKLF